MTRHKPPFKKGQRVYHRVLRRYGTYDGRHNWGTPETSPETSSYVVFDNDREYPDGRPVTTHLLSAAPPGE